MGYTLTPHTIEGHMHDQDRESPPEGLFIPPGRRFVRKFTQTEREAFAPEKRRLQELQIETQELTERLARMAALCVPTGTGLDIDGEYFFEHVDPDSDDDGDPEPDAPPEIPQAVKDRIQREKDRIQRQTVDGKK